MNGTFVALDLETTGLDPTVDRIIEIGALRMDREGRVLETFESFVSPGRDIPPFVQQLTGITADDVRDAPTLDDLAPALVRFVGEGPLVGQNVRFDLGFLRRAGVFFEAPAIDTAELSRVLMPERQRRGLDSLAGTLGVDVESSTRHRALADARSAADVYLALQRRAEAIPAVLRGQLARLVALRDPVLALAVAGDEWNDAGGPLPPLQLKPPAQLIPLERRDPPLPIARSSVDRVFAAAPRVFPGFEERSEQREMAYAVGSAFAGGGHWLVEAGTGVGKSLAYLIPAALHALQNGERVVVSTNTINLQEQLLTKDVPALRRMLCAAGLIEHESDLRVSLLKGRANYLCLRRWSANLATGAADPDFGRLAANMLLWLPETETGDRSELSLDSSDWVTWQRISAQDVDCLGSRHPFVRDGTCFLQRARKVAEAAHIVIVNHALLLADIASGGSAIPPFDHLIVDEAHNLEEQATQQFGGSVSRRLLLEALDGLYHRGSRESREGGVATLLTSFPEGATKMAGEQLQAAVSAAAQLLVPTLSAFAALLRPAAEDERTLISPALRETDAWLAAEDAWRALDRALGQVATRAAEAVSLLRETALTEDPDVLAGEIETAARRVEAQRLLFASLVGSPGPEQVAWVAADRDGLATLNVAPLDVGPHLREHLFSKCTTAVATSATLSAAGDMSFTARRIGMEGARTLQLGSPYDYGSSVLLCAFTDIPEPADPGYDEATARAIATLATISGGRALALFTSHASLRRAAELARPALEAAGISPLVQGEDGNPRQLIERLIARPQSVVFGTASFWEGVDIKGDTLSLVIVARLPFAVPTDPVHRARSEQYADPFGEYALPSAIVRFRQGFGRLIRDHADRGAVAVLDRRIYSRQYGERFVRALPPCTMTRGSVDVVAERLQQWLQR